MSQKPAQIITPEAARALLWKRGELSFKLHKAQLEMRDAFYGSDGLKFVINSSRQLGKSFFLCVLAIQEALKNPNSQIKYAAPTQRMVRQIIKPIFRQILADCPVELRPEWQAQESRYVFKHNDSQIDIAGADSGNAERLRGTRMHLGIVDEAGFCADLSYLIQDVMLPMTITTGGRIIIASTPAKTPQHPFEKYWEAALLENSCIRRTIYDNPMLTPKALQKYILECGGEDTTTWKREYLAEFVIDKDSVVIPEFRDVQDEVVKGQDRPAYYDSYVSLDPGYRDLTVALFGYWDFLQAHLVIEDEFVLSKTRTDILADGIKDKERILWGDKKPYFRVSDTDLILIQDLQDLHNLQFVTTDKDNKLAQINELRVMIQAKRVIIHPRCKTLISHLRNAVWDTSNKDTFARVEGFSHFDSVDALLYMLRNVRRSHNPYPTGKNYDHSNTFVAFNESTNSPTAKTLQRIFTSPLKRPIR